jgi:hypothetical protein
LNDAVWRGNRLPCQQFCPYDLLAHVIARANAIRQFRQDGPPTGSQLASLLFENSVCVSLQSEFSNDQIESSALLSSGCGTEPISDQRILPWRFAVCEPAYIHANFTLPPCRLSALLKHADGHQECLFIGEDRK